MLYMNLRYDFFLLLASVMIQLSWMDLPGCNDSAKHECVGNTFEEKINFSVVTETKL